MDKYQFKLIQGDFSPQDAKTVLMSVINSKINFHNLNAFSEFVKNNEDCEISKRRISVLSSSIKDINKLLEESERNGKRLKINGDITIEFI
jgi:adenine C2-methylase RlmN of 23S rRNA A2503 and tRNA A37